MEKRRGVIMDRKISRKLKGKVLDSCVVPASTYGLETLDLSELHQHKLQVCDNNWMRKIARVRRGKRRRMKDQREEVGTKACIVGKIVKGALYRIQILCRWYTFWSYPAGLIIVDRRDNKS